MQSITLLSLLSFIFKLPYCLCTSCFSPHISSLPSHSTSFYSRTEESCSACLFLPSSRDIPRGVCLSSPPNSPGTSERTGGCSLPSPQTCHTAGSSSPCVLHPSQFPHGGIGHPVAIDIFEGLSLEPLNNLVLLIHQHRVIYNCAVVQYRADDCFVHLR